MFDRIWELMTAVDVSTVAALPGWAAAAGATFVLVAGMLAFVRNGRGGQLVQVAVVVVLLLLGWLVLDQSARGVLIAERRALDQRAFGLGMRALAPGSALACLDAMAGEKVEESCEKALFASPDAAAAAVSYVAAQLLLLAAGSDYASRGAASSAMSVMRRAVEADRFGIAAHVLAARYGCTLAQCDAFFLRDASRINSNLARRPFETYVQTHMAGWQSAGNRHRAASNPDAAVGVPVAGTKVPLYFPSSASIPSVNIMTAEPAASQRVKDKTLRKWQDKSKDKPRDTTGATETSAAAPSRKP